MCVVGGRGGGGGRVVREGVVGGGRRVWCGVVWWWVVAGGGGGGWVVCVGGWWGRVEGWYIRGAVPTRVRFRAAYIAVLPRSSFWQRVGSACASAWKAAAVSGRAHGGSGIGAKLVETESN